MVLAEHIRWARCSRYWSSVSETSLEEKCLVETMWAQAILRVNSVQQKYGISSGQNDAFFSACFSKPLNSCCCQSVMKLRYHLCRFSYYIDQELGKAGNEGVVPWKYRITDSQNCKSRKGPLEVI